LLTGDDLSIQLFIGATAIAILGVAVTQAGWTHKGFVWSLFVIAGGLSLIAVFWKPIRDANPEIGPVASSVAGSSISWFTLLLVGFGAVFFLDLLARIGWFADRRSGREVEQKNNKEPENKAIEPTKEKIFIDVTPAYLIGLYEDRTEMQANVLASAFMGKWISVSGKVINVAEGKGYCSIAFHDADKKFVSAVCYGETMKTAASIRRGQTVLARGEIAAVDQLRLRLEECEITIVS
jgi:hypothetical protein